MWTSWGSGRVPICVNNSDDDFSEVEKTGGEKAVTLNTSTAGSYPVQNEGRYELGLSGSSIYGGRVMANTGYCAAHNNL